MYDNSVVCLNRIRVLVAMATWSCHLTYNGKNENRHLLLSHCRYFGKSFTEMFLKQSSTKHIIFVDTSHFDWLSWQPKGWNCKKYSKINSSKAIWGIKLKLCRIVHNISLYENIIFYCRCLSTLVAMATLIFHGLKMGKMKIGIYCYLIADIMTEAFQKCLLSGPLPHNTRLCRETIIRPVLDYGDIMYDSCLKWEPEALKKFQRKAALVCTGAFQITSHEKLLKEIGWSKLESWRSMHRLTLFYKIANSLAPAYLQQTCRLVPHNTDNYRLRRNNSFLVPFVKREIFSKSYFPKAIREWNNLSNEIKASGSLIIFESKLNEIYEPNKSNPLLGYGHGWSKVNHCRIRLGLSHLRQHLFNYHLIESPSCEQIECSNVLETPERFFLECPRYSHQRRNMLRSISDLMFPGVNYNTVIELLGDYFCKVLLEGSIDLNLDENKLLFDIVFKYIDESGRFNHQWWFLIIRTLILLFSCTCIKNNYKHNLYASLF